MTRLYAQSTRVPVSQTRGEIEQLLTRHHAKQFGTAVDYDGCRARVQFRIDDRIVRFVIGLPDRTKLGDDAYAKAERQRWRALLLVIKAKLESITNGIETFDEAFLSHVVLPDDRTVGDIVRPQVAEMYTTGRMLKQLTAGDPS